MIYCKKIIYFIFLISCTSAFSQWTPQTASINAQLYDVYFTDTDTGYTCGSGGLIYKTNDSGDNWNLIYSNSSAIWYSGLYFFTPEIGFSVGGLGKIIKTIDGGNNWTQQISGVSNALVTIDCPADDTCFVCGHGIVLKTTDGGINWQTKYTGTESFSDIDFVDSQNGYVVGDKTMKTSDGGNNWSIMDSLGGLSVSFVNKDTGFVATNYDTVKKTIDGGNTWQRLYTQTNNFYFTGIQALNQNLVFLVCTCGVVSVVKTIDGGSTWQSQVQPNDTFGGNNIFFIDDYNGWIVGTPWQNSHSVYHTTNGGVTYIDENLIPKSQIEIYPNPTSNELFVYSVQKSIIEILNINGQIIKTILNNSKSTIVDLTDLTNGVYIVRVKTDKEIVTKKIINE